VYYVLEVVLAYFLIPNFSYLISHIYCPKSLWAFPRVGVVGLSLLAFSGCHLERSRKVSGIAKELEHAA